jgi:HlyD family secretion protein
VQNVVTYDAVIDVDNSDLKLRPGMTANVTFVFANKDDVLRVTNAALRFRPSPDLVSALKLEMPHGRRSGSDGASGVRRGSGRASARGRLGESDEPPDRRTVWVLRNDLPSPVRIKTGTTDGSKTEVVDGPCSPGIWSLATPLFRRDSSRPSTGTGMLPGAGPPPGGPRRF